MNERKEDDEKNVCMYQAFFEMMKEWIIKDYFNPSIKSEVIWDTLLSEFVCDFLNFHINKDNNLQDNFILLAKEFPISNKDNISKENINQIDLLSSKIDYLIGHDKSLYFVELKTTCNSFDDTQYERYKGYTIPGGNELLWSFYDLIIMKNKIGLFKNEILNRDITGTKKYVFQLDELKKALNMLPIEIRNEMLSDSELIGGLNNYYENISLVYLTMYEITNTEVEQIVISKCFDKMDDFIADDKKLKWEAVKQIISELINKGNKQYGLE